MDDRLKKSEWWVHSVSPTIARRLVEKYHYSSGAPNTATYLHGLFRKGDIWGYQCVGVAWWLPPTKNAGYATYPANGHGVLSLSRLVILPDVPKNAASFLLAGSRKLINRIIWPCLVTYADKWQGHSGAIYRADNWEYMGETKPQPCYVINGRMIARKVGPVSRTHDEMIALGAELLGSFAKHKFRRVIA